MTSEDTQAAYAKMRYDSYLAHRQTLIQIEADQTRSFDKSMLSVASGALALSIAFSDKMVPETPEFTWLLFTSWFAFCGSILSTTCSFLIAARALARQRENFDASFAAESEGPEPPNPFGPWIARLNALSLALIFFGALCLTSFAAANFEKRSQAEHAQTTATEAAVSGSSGPPKCPYPDQSATVTQSGRAAASIGPAAPSKSKATKERMSRR